MTTNPTGEASRTAGTRYTKTANSVAARSRIASIAWVISAGGKRQSLPTGNGPDVGRGPYDLFPDRLGTVDTDEELIDGLSFLAYRRVATLLHLPSTSSRAGTSEIIAIDPSELEAALKRDIRQSGSHE